MEQDVKHCMPNASSSEIPGAMAGFFVWSWTPGIPPVLSLSTFISQTRQPTWNLSANEVIWINRGWFSPSINEWTLKALLSPEVGAPWRPRRGWNSSFYCTFQPLTPLPSLYPRCLCREELYVNREPDNRAIVDNQAHCPSFEPASLMNCPAL